MKSKQSLKSKLLALLLICIIAPLTVSGTITYMNVQKIMKSGIESNLEEILGRVGSEINLKTDSIKEKVEILANTYDIVSYAEQLNNPQISKEMVEGARNSVKSFFENVSYICEDIVIMNKDGKVILNSQGGKLVGQDNSDREYYKSSIQGKAGWSEIIISKVSNNAIIMYSMPLKNSKGIVQGVLAAAIKVDAITEILHDIKVGQTGYPMMIDAKGRYLYHPNKEKIMKSNILDESKFDSYFNENAKKMIAGESGKAEGKIGGIKNLIVYKSLKVISIAIIVPVDEYMGGAFKIRNETIILGIITIIIGTILSLYISNKITNPILKLMGLMKNAENGDLTTSAEIETNDEIGALANSYNNMIEGQKRTIKSIKDVAQVVDASTRETRAISEEMAATAENQTASAEELTVTIGEMSKSIISVTDNIADMVNYVGEVSNSMREISTSSQELAEDAEEAAKSVSQVSNELEKISISSKNISKNTVSASHEFEKTVEVADEGKAIVENTIVEMDNISLVVKNVTEVIQGLGDTAGEIGEIIEVINDIAEQTNLLSLNASIEAARAGEHGKGFAVVAGAIGNLAEKSGKATKDIGKLISQIQTEVGKAVKTTESGEQQVQSGVELVRNTGDAFNKIFEAINNSSKLISEISVAVKEQANANNLITESMEKVNGMCVNVSSIAEEQTAYANDMLQKVDDIYNLVQGIASTTEEQSSSSEEILSAAETVTDASSQVSTAAEEVAITSEALLEQVENLKGTVLSFKLD